MLMKNKDIKIDTGSEIVKLYDELDLKSRFMIDVSSDKVQHLRNVYGSINEKFLEVNPDKYEVTDILVEYLYNHKPANFKTTLWECFGDVIIDNLKQNIKQPLDSGWIMCEICGKRVEYYNNRKYCDECYKEKQKEWDRKYQKNKYQRENFLE